MKNTLIVIIALSLFSCKTKKNTLTNHSKKNSIEKTVVEFYNGYLDENGDPIVDENYSFGKTVSYFDKSGNLIEEISYGDHGGQSARQLHSYDSKNNRTQTQNFDFNDVLISTENYVYVKNRLSEINEYNVKGELLKKTIMSYNKDGDLLSEETISEVGKLIHKKTFEISNDYKVLVFFNENNLEDFRTFSKYDSKGELIERKVQYPYGDESEIKFTYELNSKGDWVKRMMSLNNDEVLEFTLRRIIYYN
jgi:hypothetical protein